MTDEQNDRLTDKKDRSHNPALVELTKDSSNTANGVVSTVKKIASTQRSAAARTARTGTSCDVTYVTDAGA